MSTEHVKQQDHADYNDFSSHAPGAALLGEHAHERSVGSVGPVPVRTYTARRFWEAGVLSLASLQTGMQWMAYSPIQDQVQHAYGWPASSFPLFAAYGPLVCLLTVPFVPALTRALSLRSAVTLASCVIAVSASLRTYTTAAPSALVLAHLSCFVNALAGPLLLSTPPQLSSLWFPPRERTTATSFMLASNIAGTCVGFLAAQTVGSDADVLRLLRLEQITGLLGFAIAAAGHFIFRDPLPPPTGPAAGRLATINGGGGARPSSTSMSQVQVYMALLRHRPFVLLMGALGGAMGTFTAWTGVVYPLLKPLGYSSAQADWIGFASGIGQVLATLAAGAAADRCAYGRVKPVIVGMYGGASLALLIFGVLCTVPAGSLPAAFTSMGVISASVTLGGMLLMGSEGLIYEAAVRASSDVLPAGAAAGSVGSLLTFAFNVPCAAFLLVTASSSSFARSLTWAVSIVCVVCTLLLAAWRERN